MALMVLMGISSCSKDAGDEPAPLLSDAITFGAIMQPASDVTRAEDDPTPLHTKAETFKVWAFKNLGIVQSSNPYDYTNPQCVIADYTVRWADGSANTTTTNSSGWEYADGNEQTVKYWDTDAKAYKFFGYAPETARVTAWLYKPSNDTWEEFEPYDLNWTNGFDFTYCRLSTSVNASDEEHAPYVSHLWFSNNSTETGMIPYGSTVQLKFIKPLVKVRFMFIYSNEGGQGETTIKDQMFRPIDLHAGIAISGNVLIDYPLTGTITTELWDTEPKGYMKDNNGENKFFTQDWYQLTAAEEEALDLTKPEDQALKDNQEYWYTVMPAKNQGSYILMANINDADQSAVVPAEYMVWAPGHSYTYIFKITQDGEIKFDGVQVAIRKWNEIPEQRHEVYNW